MNGCFDEGLPMKSLMVAGLLALTMPGMVRAQLGDKKVLTLAAAKEMAAAAEAEATRNGWNLVIVILDDGGNLLYLQRMDGVQLASIQVAQAKARTALLYRRPTRDFADRMTAGNTPLAMPEVMPLEGGLPIVVNGQVIGSIAASGATGAQDAQASQKGIDALLARLGASR
jgi:glc operon protein GlcG